MPDDGTDAAIRTVLERWAEAMRRKDAAAVMQEGAGRERVAYSLAPPLVQPAGDGAGLQAWFDTWQGQLRYELHDLAVTADGAVAFCHGLTRLAGRKTDGAAADLWFRQTLGLRRIDGAWKIFHQHESVPFHMDGSYRAAVELEP